MIICVDLDSTLLRSDKTISQYTISIFNKLRLNGHILVINSARSLSRCESFLDLIDFDYCICNGGSNIYKIDKNSRICTYDNPINKYIVFKACNEFVKYSEYISIQTLDYLYTTEQNPKVSFVTKIPIKNTFMFDAYKIIIYKGIKSEMENICDKYNLDYIIYENGPYGKVSKKDVTKLSGLIKLLEYIHESLDKVIFFGDDIGDLECINACGEGVAMKNSVEEVLNNVKIICDTNDNDGVAKYLNKLIEEKKL